MAKICVLLAKGLANATTTTQIWSTNEQWCPKGDTTSLFLAPLAITNISTTTTFALVIKEIRSYAENNQHLDGDTGLLMNMDAVFVMQQTELDNRHESSSRNKQAIHRIMKETIKEAKKSPADPLCIHFLHTTNDFQSSNFRDMLALQANHITVTRYTSM